MEALVLGEGLHFASFTQKMSKIVPIIKDVRGAIECKT